MTETSDTANVAGQCLDAMLAIIQAQEEELHKLDAVAGDGDHGAGMVRGLKAAVAVPYQGTAGDVLSAAGSAFSNAAGGASGALVGMFLLTIGNGLKTDQPEAATVHTALANGLAVMKKLGKSDVGDKTMIDTLDPFIVAFGEAATNGQSIPEAWSVALPAAAEGRDSTINMIAKKGRSAVLKEKSQGTADPGATSMYYMLQAVSEILATNCIR